MAATESYLKGKSILAVDDEEDILETIEDILEDAQVDLALDYETASEKIRKNQYDLAILDIMGVNGIKLLEEAVARGIPTVMLTAHALTPDNLKKSIEMGADAYIPKDKMVDICLYVEDVLISRQDRRKTNFKWYYRLGPLFDEIFGDGWKDPEAKFWQEFDKKHAA